MSEEKIVSQANVVSVPTLKIVLDEVPSPYPKRDGRHQIHQEIKQPGTEMEIVVTKLITHFKENF